jgi:hypothetical protein
MSGDADEAKTIAVPAGQFWMALAAVGGLSGIGSFVGVSSVDSQPSERLARLEQALANIEMVGKDTRDAIANMQKGSVSVDSRLSALEWRMGLCEETTRRRAQESR